MALQRHGQDSHAGDALVQVLRCVSTMAVAGRLANVRTGDFGGEIKEHLGKTWKNSG